MDLGKGMRATALFAFAMLWGVKQLVAKERWIQEKTAMWPWLLATVMTILSVPVSWTTVKAHAPKADSEAAKLLAGARNSRSLWKRFCGFSADIEVNLDGKVSRGKVQIDYNGKARYQDLNKEAEAWARPVLASIVDHCLDTLSHDTTCAFAEDDKHHPLGRAILALNDELHSRYRIRDNQIRQVERQTKDRRFTISVLEYRKNAEGKYLPVSYVADYWDLKTGNLVKGEDSHQTWTRIWCLLIGAQRRSSSVHLAI